jgi:FkbM family methyltransferase
LEQQTRWYRRLLDLDGEVIVDVGANVGELSQFFWSRCGKKGRVISVEPHPANIKLLDKRIRRAGTKRWTLKRCAVSDRQGSVVLRKLSTSGGNNAVVVEGPAPKGVDFFTAPCLTLSQLAPDATVVKLDVEGHEHTILPSAVPALDNVKAWAIELHMVDKHRLQDTLTLLTDHGFALIGAGRRRDAPSQWLDVAIAPTLSWDDLPGQRAKRDGRTATFKMLHIVARR